MLRVQEHGAGESHAKHLDDVFASEDEGAEDEHHDRRGGGDHAAGRGQPVGDGLGVVLGVVPGLVDAADEEDVVEPGSEPASVEPVRIERNGTAISSISAVARPAMSAGRARSTSAQRRHAGDSSLWDSSPAARARRAPRVNARNPMNPSRAGVKVSAARTVNATTTLAAMPTPPSTLTRRASIPRSAMQTVAPANRTARPEVSSAWTVASSLLSPRIKACR